MNNRIVNFLAIYLIFILNSLLNAQSYTEDNKLKSIDCYHNKFSFQIMLDFTNPITYSKTINNAEGTLRIYFPGMKIVNFNPKDVTNTLEKLQKQNFIHNVSVTEEFGKVILSISFPTKRRLSNNKIVKNRLLIGFRKINDLKNHKLIIDICPNELLNNNTIQYAHSSAIHNDYTKLLTKQIIPTKNNNDWRIIIDPGHGGKDPGTLGIGGLKEKEIALKIARLLAKKLCENGYNAHLTRSTDTHLSALERTNFAHQLNADLFVSIHLNSGGVIGDSNKGIETFYMHNPETETNSQVRDYIFVNQEENQQLINKAERQLKNTLNLSKKLATAIQDNLISTLKTNKYSPKNRGIKPQNYRLILRNTLPTALIEVGFLTNKDEARLLSSHTYQKILSDGIYDGIKNYTNAQTE